METKYRERACFTRMAGYILQLAAEENHLTYLARRAEDFRDSIQGRRAISAIPKAKAKKAEAKRRIDEHVCENQKIAEAPKPKRALVVKKEKRHIPNRPHVTCPECRGKVILRKGNPSMDSARLLGLTAEQLRNSYFLGSHKPGGGPVIGKDAYPCANSGILWQGNLPVALKTAP